MENGKESKSGKNCSFSSYISSESSENMRERGGAYSYMRTQAENRWGEKHGGIFSEVRRLRREDEAREARFSRLRSVHFAERREPSAAAQAGKFAVLLACICAFSLLFALKMANSAMPGETLAVFRTAMNGGSGGEEEEERLGRLQLIQLPGLLSVFAASDSPIAPLSSEQAITDDSFTARIFSSAGTEVVSMLSGTVRSVDPQGEHGGSVIVSCKNGIEITYMGLCEIPVERGQPVLQRTVLGKLEGEILFLRITKDGRPVDPLEFLGTAANIG